MKWPDQISRALTRVRKLLKGRSYYQKEKKFSEVVLVENLLVLSEYFLRGLKV